MKKIVAEIPSEDRLYVQDVPPGTESNSFSGFVCSNPNCKSQKVYANPPKRCPVCGSRSFHYRKINF